MDRFSDFPTNLVAPARDGAAVVPNDSLDLAQLPRALFIGGTGNVSVTLAGGQALIFQNCPAGSVLPVRARRVHMSGTTATAIVALW
jgi:hypothetical protein